MQSRSMNLAAPSRQTCDKKNSGFTIEPLEVRTLLSVTLAADLSPGDFGSWPEEFTSAGNEVYFFAPGPFLNTSLTPTTTALWKTDGTKTGTSLVKDGIPVESRYTFPGALTEAGGRVYFTDSEIGTGNNDLWVSDGTAAGTKPLSNVHAIAAPGDIVEYHGNVYFTAQSDSGPELWTTDGTDAGTMRFPGLPSDAPVAAVKFAGSQFLYFVTGTGSDLTLWRTDGSDGGTEELTHLSGLQFPPGVQFTEVGGNVYFVAPISSPNDLELWKTDGTPEGTGPVKDIFPGARSSGISYLTSSSGTLYFSAGDTVASGNQVVHGLWKSDGTADGTVKVLDHAPNVQFELLPQLLTPINGGVVFIGQSKTGLHLWKSDGTPEGTTILDAIKPGVEVKFGLHRAGNQIYFAADDSVHGLELWRSGGIPGDAALVADLAAGKESGLSSAYFTGFPAAVLGDRLVFSASDTAVGGGGPEPWITDGTPNGTFQLANINTTGFDSVFTWSMALGDTVLVGANSRIYRSDGTPQGTGFLSDRVGPLNQVLYAGRAVIGSVAVFPGADRSANFKPRYFRSDGTAAGTYPLLDGVEPSYQPLVTANGFAFFIGQDADHGTALWRTDGTTDGTILLKDISPEGDDGYGFGGGSLAAVGGTVYFKSSYGELWKTNGTPDGTTLVRDLGVSREQSYEFRNFAAVGDKFFFEAPNGGEVPSMWVSDGTGLGTRPLPAIVAYGSIVGFNGAAYFAGAESFGSPTKLYRSDGTAADTLPIKELTPTAFEVFGDLLFFVAEDGLWKTDGSADGTVRLAAFAVPHLPDSLTAGPDALYFTADDGVNGRELWRSDGTAAGTRMVQDLYPGANGSSPTFLTVVGDTLFFAAKEPLHGNELWKVSPPQAIGATVGSKAWSDGFLTALHAANMGEGGFALSSATLSSPLPWSNLNRIQVQFDDDGVAQAQSLKVTGADGRAYTAELENYDSDTHIATWSLPTLSHAERVNIALGASQWSFDLLPGDVDRTGVVNASDLVNVRNRVGRSVAMQGSGVSAYSVFSDVNGDGVVNASDLVLARNRVGTSFSVPPAMGMVLFSGKRIFDPDKSADSLTL